MAGYQTQKLGLGAYARPLLVVFFFFFFYNSEVYEQKISIDRVRN